MQPVIIEADGNSPVAAVEAQSDVTVQGENTKVEKVTVPEAAANEGVKLTVDGAAVENVTAEKPVTIEATNGASPIEKVEAKDDLTVKGTDAKIEQVQVPNTATKQPVIDVQAGTVSEVKADKPAEVKSTTGTGAVTNVEANAEVKVASETVTTITVTVQVTVTVLGTSNVEVAVSTEQAVNITTQSTATVAVSTKVDTGVDVKLNNTQVEHIHKWNTNPKLHPYELVTKEQAAELLNRLGNKILGTTDVSYSDLSGSGYLCRTENIDVENEDWKTSELRQTVDGLENCFDSLRLVEVKNEAGLLAALKLPYVREIHVTESMTILGTKDESDPNFAGCCYLNNEGHNPYWASRIPTEKYHYTCIGIRNTTMKR